MDDGHGYGLPMATMKTPGQVIAKLTPEQEKQAQDILDGVASDLATQDDVTFNINVTRATIPEIVWDEVVRAANEAGWTAARKGANVTISRP
jgi:hypothetical protein